MIVYADSSFLVSLYVLDRHSKDALARLRGHATIVITPFHQAELANAFYQCVFRSTLTEFEAARAWKRFDDDLRNNVLQSSSFPDAAWARSISLAHRFCPALGVRTLDTLHVACALELHPDRFWTFDARQQQLAETVGLNTTA